LLLEILDPTVTFDDENVSATFDLDRPLAGAAVGLRLDHAWRSYMVVVEAWKQLLARDGAVPQIIWTGERVGPAGEKTRADLDEWSRLIDCGVVGLGN
jgi:hypothetical protein